MSLKFDVLLLADLFGKFRNSCQKNDGLCPSHCLSASAFNWDTKLYMTKVEFELFSNEYVYLFFEKGVRGGIPYHTKRYSKASSKNITYDPNEDSKHIIYLGANNLNVYSMSKFLPTGGFKQIDPKNFDSNKYSSNSSKCSLLVVDLEFFKEFCELNDDYPLAPDKIEMQKGNIV